MVCPLCDRDDRTRGQGFRGDRQKGECLRCHRYFTVTSGPSVRARAIAQHHLDGIPYRKLVRTYRWNKDRLNRTTNRVTAQLPPNDAITERLHSTYRKGI